MKITSRIGAAWRALTGQRSDPYAATYGAGGTHGFAGGAINRLTASLATFSGSVNADLDGALPVLRARARHLAANNEHGKRFLSLVATNVVGRQNPRLQVRAMKDQRNPLLPTTLDKAANDTVERHWERWGQTCDIANRHKTLYSLLRTTVKGVARDGEALIRVIRDKKLLYGMALQLLEADRLDDAFNAQLDNGNTIRQGVEVDSTLRAVAYYIKTAHPGENYAVQRAGTERVPAGDIYHLFTPERAEQVRGITWFHAVILRGSVIHAYEEAAVIAAQIGASKVAALERSDDSADMGPGAGMADGMSGGLPQFKVEAGEMFELPPGYKLSSWNPDYPHANFESFLKACLRGLAAGMDVAAHNLTGDMTEVNYSSARIAELNEREMWMVLQDWLITSFVQPLYEEWLAINLLTGKITFEMSGKALPADRYEKFRSASRFQGRRWAWVDPAKEADANAKLLETGLTSRTRLAAEQGEEFEDILGELAQENVLMEAAGLSKPAVQQTAPPEPEDEPPEEEEPEGEDQGDSPEVMAARIIVAGRIRCAEINREAAEISARHAQPAVFNFNPTTNVAAPEVTVEVDAIMPGANES